MNPRGDEGTETEGVVTCVETKGGREVYTVVSGGDTLLVYQSDLRGRRFFNSGDRVRFRLWRGRVYRMESR